MNFCFLRIWPKKYQLDSSLKLETYLDSLLKIIKDERLKIIYLRLRQFQNTQKTHLFSSYKKSYPFNTWCLLKDHTYLTNLKLKAAGRICMIFFTRCQVLKRYKTGSANL